MIGVWRPPRRPDHNHVDAGDAIGIAIRIPVERLAVVADLLAPHVASELVLGQPDFVTVYPTIGRDTLNGRRVPHRWVNVICDPPTGIPRDAGIGGLACIGAPSSAINRMWRRRGLTLVPGRLWMTLDRDPLRARVQITTKGGTLTTSATFGSTGEAWEILPQHYHLMDPARPLVFMGDEWGTTHEGRGRVEFRTQTGIEALNADTNLDLDLGWDYVFGMPAPE